MSEPFDPELISPQEARTDIDAEALGSRDRVARVVSDVKAMLTMSDEDESMGCIDPATGIEYSIHFNKPRTYVDRANEQVVGAHYNSHEITFVAKKGNDKITMIIKTKYKGGSEPYPMTGESIGEYTIKVAYMGEVPGYTQPEVFFNRATLLVRDKEYNPTNPGLTVFPETEKEQKVGDYSCLTALRTELGTIETVLDKVKKLPRM